MTQKADITEIKDKVGDLDDKIAGFDIRLTVLDQGVKRYMGSTDETIRELKTALDNNTDAIRQVVGAFKGLEVMGKFIVGIVGLVGAIIGIVAIL